MTDATRAIALTEAVKFINNETTDDEVLVIAAKFNDFLTADTAAQKPQKTSKPQPPKQETEIVGKSKPAKSEEQVVEEATKAAPEDDGPTEDTIGKAIAELLAAGKRDELVKLLAKHGGKSKSTLPKANYQKFLDAANELLLDA